MQIAAGIASVLVSQRRLLSRASPPPSPDSPAAAPSPSAMTSPPLDVGDAAGLGHFVVVAGGLFVQEDELARRRHVVDAQVAAAAAGYGDPVRPRAVGHGAGDRVLAREREGAARAGWARQRAV